MGSRNQLKPLLELPAALAESTHVIWFLPMNTHLHSFLYVQPETLARLIASGRVQVQEDGMPTFKADDTRYPSIALLESSEVTGHAVHRQVWSGYDQRRVFEYVGDV